MQVLKFKIVTVYTPVKFINYIIKQYDIEFVIELFSFGYLILHGWQIVLVNEKYILVLDVLYCMFQWGLET